MKTPTKPVTDIELSEDEQREISTNRYKTPFKSEADKATKMIRAYLTPGELATFEAGFRVAKIGRSTLSRSQYIKERLVAKEVKEFDPSVDFPVPSKRNRKKEKQEDGESEKTNREDIKLMSHIQLNRLDALVDEMNRIGKNYNQSTRRLNQFDLPAEILKESRTNKGLERQLIELSERVNKLVQELEDQLTKKG